MEALIESATMSKRVHCGGKVQGRQSAIPLFYYSTVPLFHSTVPHSTESRHPRVNSIALDCVQPSPYTQNLPNKGMPMNTALI